mmetsp:Transcript_128423/g.411692  ORF Transcript_128423/g.411692 Transcript_128423/m.411692 type:complete len:116 (-) Transcript_128423:1275-1622(-)
MRSRPLLKEEVPGCLWPSTFVLGGSTRHCSKQQPRDLRLRSRGLSRKVPILRSGAGMLDSGLFTSLLRQANWQQYRHWSNSGQIVLRFLTKDGHLWHLLLSAGISKLSSIWQGSV